MRIWLDDERPMPPSYHVHAATAEDALVALSSGRVTHISLDHDLGPVEAGTGYEVAVWIEEAAHRGQLPPLTWEIHSANPVGRRRMEMAMRSADKAWGK